MLVLKEQYVLLKLCYFSLCVGVHFIIIIMK